MAKKVVNIDDLLAQNLLELTVRGKTYQVKDFNLEEFLRLMNDPKNEDPENQQKIVMRQIAKAFEVDESELADLGLKTLMLIIQEIRDWVVGEVEDVAGVDTENP